MPLGAAAIGGIAAGASALASTGANIYGGAVKNRKQRKWAEEQATLEWQRKYRAWEAMNEYNHPAAQKERLQQAGLNPALMYQQGNPGNASTMPQVTEQKTGGYEWQGMDLGSAMSAFLMARKTQAETDNLRKIGEGIDLANANRGMENAIKQKIVEHLSPKWEYQTEAWRLANEYKSASIAKAIAEEARTQKENRWSDEKWKVWNEAGLNIDRDDKWSRMIFSALRSLGLKMRDLPGLVMWGAPPESATFRLKGALGK